MTDITRIYNAEKRSFSNVQRCYSGQQFDSVATTLHFEYVPEDFLDGYTPYIMFNVHDDDGNPLVYGPDSLPAFDGRTFPIPWDVTSRIKSQRVEYQLYFVSTGGFIYDESAHRYVEKGTGTEYQLSASDGIALKPSITPRKGRCGCPPPLMAPTTEPSVVGFINLWKQYGLIAPVRTSLDVRTGLYTLTFQTFNGDEYSVDMAVDTTGVSALTQDLEVNNPVGGVPYGHIFPRGTGFEEILRMILHIDVPEAELICMYGGMTSMPTASSPLTGLISDGTRTWTNIASEPWEVTIPYGTGSGRNAVRQYPVIVLSDSLMITSWKTKALSTEQPFQSVDGDGYTIYYLYDPNSPEAYPGYSPSGTDFVVTVQSRGA